MADVLDEVVALIEADPHSGQALNLFALLKTLDVPRGGHMYMLKKLADLTPENRRLAYGLMELLASGGNTGERWQAALGRAERAIATP